MNESSVGKYTNENSILTFNPPLNLKLLFHQFNGLTTQSNKKNPEHFINCINLDIDEIQKIKIEPNSLSLLCTNSCSLDKSFEGLKYLLKTTNKTFDVIAISQSRILKDIHLSKNIYTHTHTHIYIYIHTYTHIHIYTHTHTHTYIYIYMYNYSVEFTLTTESHAGETLIYINNNLYCKVRQDLCIYKSSEL